jgi:hypothetical protein
MDPIQVLGQMKQSLGVKYEPMPKLLRYATSENCSPCTQQPPQVFADATLVFPMLVAATFAQS